MKFKTIMRKKYNNQKNGCSQIQTILQFGEEYLKYSRRLLRILIKKNGLQTKTLAFDFGIYKYLVS
jgi:hypothetical protein